MIKFKLNGVDFQFSKDDSRKISNFDWFVGYLRDGEWEKFTFEIFDKCANPNKIALDIGAWIGLVFGCRKTFLKFIHLSLIRLLLNR